MKLKSIKNMKTPLLALCLMLSLYVAAQTTVGSQNSWLSYLEQVMTEEDVESTTWDTVYDLLCDLEQHPIDLNVATREQLESLPFLSSQQIEELLEYRYHYGSMKSLAELQMIQSLDYNRRQLLKCFSYVSDDSQQQFPSLKDIVKYGHHELMTTVRIPFYERKGDRNTYLGYPYRHWMRWQFTEGEEVKIGIVGSQDAGEPFFSNRNSWGYDYYAAYFQLRHLGRLDVLCLGQYRVSMAMGLVMNSDFSLGKVAILQNMGRHQSTIRAHSSRSDTYLQGAGATVDLGRGLKLTSFFSWRPKDATLNKDETVSSILSSGYHRTKTEMEKKHNLHEIKTGSSLRYQNNGFNASANVVYTHLDRTLNPNTAVLYRRHYPLGRDFFNTSVGYGYVNSRVALNGEFAIDKSGHLATINSISVRLMDHLNLMTLQRFYSYRYTSLDAQSFSEGGRVQNESGYYIGFTWQPLNRLRLSGYIDVAYFPWARYQVSQSSYAWDHLLEGVYTHQKWTLSARYRLRRKEKDNVDKTDLNRYSEHRARMSAVYTGASGFGWRFQIDGGYYALEKDEWGAMASTWLSYTRNWLRLNGGVGYFHTDSYDSRVYLYEQGPLYNYGVMQFYGEGIRYWLMARAAIGKQLAVTVKIGVTDYFDRSYIGSSYQQISASSQTDLDVQIRWKF